jgi:hypothetical protein
MSYIVDPNTFFVFLRRFVKENEGKKSEEDSQIKAIL